MKSATPLVLSLLMVLASIAHAGWTTEYASLLKKYVTPNGVRYEAWKKNNADMAAMQQVVESVAASKENDLAFYINAYNAWILHEALAKYPTGTLKFIFLIPGRIKVGGEKMSFDHLEKGIIRAKFKEPRVHFALNCASRSCPPLNDEPFQPGTLDATLDKLAKAFVNSDRGVQVREGEAALSKIFDWYKEDFGGAEGAVKFINKRRAQPIPAGAKITYQDYNWSLNETK